MRFLFLLGCGAAFLSAPAQISPVLNARTDTGYPTIQSAVNEAEAGDTLHLAAVIFDEYLILDSTLVLLGDPEGGTVLDIRTLPGYGVHIKAGSTTIQDLTIQSGPAHTSYAIHSEPDVSGLTLRNVRVLNNMSSGIDLNGLDGSAINTIEDCEVLYCAAGFGLALSSCQNVDIKNFNSTGNGNGDVGILESAYTTRRTEDIRFSGDLTLLGVNGDGLGGIVVQSDSTVVNPGIGVEFDIDMQGDFIHKISAMTEYDGAPLGYILCTTEHVSALTQALAQIPGVMGLVSRNIASGALEIWPGMLLQDAIGMAEVGETIHILEPGDYDTSLVTIDRSLSIIGPNAGLDATDPARGVEARFTGGMHVSASQVVIDGIRIQPLTVVADGLILDAGVDNAVIRNTVIRGNLDAVGDLGQVGTRSSASVSFDACSWRNWPVGFVTEAGSAQIESSTIADNREGIRLASDGTSALRLEAEGLIMTNAGADAFAITSAAPGDSLIVTSTTGALHRHAFRFDVPIAHRVEGNVFVESEVQIIGLSNDERIEFCETNDFSMPPIVIEGCLNPAAANFESCATVDPGLCLYGGCTDVNSCNFQEGADIDDGSCEYASCADCLNPLACNYNPAATIEGDCDFDSCRGCTNPAALNFDPGATIDDGSCRIAGCLDPEADNYNPDATFDNGVCFFFGCTDAAACNYDPEANLDLGTCEFASCAGCTDDRACNYDATASQDDGSCDFLSCRGCTDPSAANYNSEATIDDGSCRILGCTATSAINYDSAATNDDGSCLFGGCTDSGACNFDPAADSDDGTCEYTSCAGCAIEGFCNYDPNVTIHDGDLCDYLSCCGDPAATNYDPDILPQLTFGCTYGQTAGMPYFSDCTLPFACNYLEPDPCEFDSCAGCTDPGACNYNPDATLSTTTCTYPVDVFGVDHVDCNGNCLNDENGNGVCDEVETSGCTDSGACNYDVQATSDDGSCEFLSCSGCTDQAACNLDAEATINDGSCEYSTCAGCTDPTACNYDAGAVLDAGCLHPEDLFGLDFLDCDGNCLNDADGDGTCDEAEVPGCTNLAACNYSSDATEADGSCDFDSCYGCTDNTACNFDPAVTELEEGACDYATCAGCMDGAACNYDALATLDLGCLYPAAAHLDCLGNCLNDADGDGVCDEFEVPGCGDVMACNFSLDATDDDGSCDYASCAGCTNPGACNYDAAASLNDGSCDYLTCQGCTDPDACNFLSDATVDDGSCIYPLDIFNDPSLDCTGGCASDADGDGICDIDEVRGCMDSGACNYDAQAEFDDESCEYASCAGCTIPGSCNYNSDAQIDNGTCSTPVTLYGSDAYDCLGQCVEDVDGDGVCDEFEIEGCKDETACNFDPEATDDDGSCLAPEEGYDCGGVCLADADGDGVCDPFEIAGCTDSSACNYDASATDEAGNCSYPIEDYLDCDGECLQDSDGDGICDINEFCVGDLNDDGIRSASDVLTILAGYGCVIECGDLDLNGDGLVTAADILAMLAVFGTYCD